jgi:Na+/phosphate symporter
MRIELIKKAGRKSDNDALTVDQQLAPIGIAHAIVIAVAAHATAALEKFYDAVNKAEEAVSKEVAKAQREVLSGFKPFQEFIEGLTSQLVDQNYVDNIGSITIPQKVREELEQIAEAAETGLVDVRQSLIDAEKAVNAWKKSTEADLHMCTIIADQRVVLAKVLSSDPTKAWKFTA